MMVRRKDNGQEGQIPDQDFDPQYYDKLDENGKSSIDNAAQAVSGGQLTMADIPQNQRIAVASYIASQNGGKIPTTADKTEATKKKGVATAAKNYLDTYNKLLSSNADLNSEDSKRQLAYAAGKYNSIAGFGEGGKVLSAAELGILAPTLIKTERQPDKNWVQRNITGGVPEMVKGYLKETPAQAAEKMKLALQNTNPELAKQYQSNNQEQKQTFGQYLGEIPGNALKDANNIIGGLAQMPGYLMNKGQEIQAEDQKASPLQSILGKALIPQRMAYKLGKEMIPGVINEANQFLGEPLKGGDIIGRAGYRMHEKPVTSALDILTVAKAVKGLTAAKSSTGRMTDVTNPNEVAALEKMGVKLPVNKNTPSQNFDNIISDRQGKMATSIAVPDTGSVTRSEALMKKAVQITKTNTDRGMARELESFSPKATNYIKGEIQPIDKTIGLQPTSEIVDEISNRLAQTSSGQANPQLIDSVVKDITKQLDVSELPGGAKRGSIYGTNLEAMNRARMYYNRQLSKWFEAGQPVGTPTNELNAMKFEATRVLKDLIGQADQSGNIKAALDAQHTAIQVAPVLSKKALTGSAASSGIRANIAKLFSDLIKPAKIKGLRSSLPSNNLIQDILNAKSAGPSQSNMPVNPINSGWQNPLPQDIVTNMLNVKGPAQATRLITDLMDKASRLRYR